MVCDAEGDHEAPIDTGDALLDSNPDYGMESDDSGKDASPGSEGTCDVNDALQDSDPECTELTEDSDGCELPNPNGEPEYDANLEMEGPIKGIKPDHVENERNPDQTIDALDSTIVEEFSSNGDICNSETENQLKLNNSEYISTDVFEENVVGENVEKTDLEIVDGSSTEREIHNEFYDKPKHSTKSEVFKEMDADDSKLESDLSCETEKNEEIHNDDLNNTVIESNDNEEVDEKTRLDSNTLYKDDMILKNTDLLPNIDKLNEIDAKDPAHLKDVRGAPRKNGYWYHPDYGGDDPYSKEVQEKLRGNSYWVPDSKYSRACLNEYGGMDGVLYTNGKPYLSDMAVTTFDIGDCKYESDGVQFARANEHLKELINDPEIRAKFSPEEIKQIDNGQKPYGHTWHHNESGNTLELVPYNPHRVCRHYGGRHENKQEKLHMAE